MRISWDKKADAGRRLAGRCAEVYRADGLRVLCARGANKVAEALWETNSADWYRADLSGQLPPVRPIDGATVDFDAWGETCDWLGELRPRFRWAHRIEEIEVARRHGHLYPLLRMGAERAGYMKVGFSRAYVADFRSVIAIPRTAAFVYDTFIHPDYRSRGLATFMIGRVIRELRRGGWLGVWCHIPGANAASIRAFKRNGFAKVRHIRYARLLRLELYNSNPSRVMHREEREFRARRLCKQRADDATWAGIATGGWKSR